MLGLTALDSCVLPCSTLGDGWEMLLLQCVFKMAQVSETLLGLYFDNNAAEHAEILAQ